MTWTPSPSDYADLELGLDGVFDTVAITVPDEYADAASVEIEDPEGTPVARLDVSSWAGNRLTGTAAPLRPREHGLFQHLRRTPADIAKEYEGQKVAAVTVDAPLDTETVQRLADASGPYDVLLLLPLIGPGAPQLASATGLMRATLAAAELLPGTTRVLPVPLAGRTDTQENADRRARVASAYGDPLDIAPPAEQLAAIGYALGRGRMLKPELVPESIGRVLRAELRPRAERGLVVFFTGFSGSGKSTLARRLRDLLLEKSDRTVTLLDGDVVRRMLSAGLGFSKAGREANIRRIGFVASEVARAGGLAICAPIAPYAATRAEVRQMVEDAGGIFVLVHVSTSLEECERRDRKGLYAKARAGEIKEFTGISDPYEVPTDADLAVDTAEYTIEEAGDIVLEKLRADGLLNS